MHSGRPYLPRSAGTTTTKISIDPQIINIKEPKSAYLTFTISSSAHTLQHRHQTPSNNITLPSRRPHPTHSNAIQHSHHHNPLLHPSHPPPHHRLGRPNRRRRRRFIAESAHRRVALCAQRTSTRCGAERERGKSFGRESKAGADGHLVIAMEGQLEVAAASEGYVCQ